MLIKFPDNKQKQLSDEDIKKGINTLEALLTFFHKDDISDDDVDMLNYLIKYLKGKGVPEEKISDTIDDYIYFYV